MLLLKYRNCTERDIRYVARVRAGWDWITCRDSQISDIEPSDLLPHCQCKCLSYAILTWCVKPCYCSESRHAYVHIRIRELGMNKSDEHQRIFWNKFFVICLSRHPWCKLKQIFVKQSFCKKSNASFSSWSSWIFRFGEPVSSSLSNSGY
jgi:hypothetical protein